MQMCKCNNIDTIWAKVEKKKAASTYFSEYKRTVL